MDYRHSSRRANYRPTKLREKSGELQPCLDLAADLFPHVVRYLPARQIATILATTRLVGMECPGLHSLCSELSLVIDGVRGGEYLQYEVAKFDLRESEARVEFTAPDTSGAIKAFARPAPQREMTYSELKQRWTARRFPASAPWRRSGTGESRRKAPVRRRRGCQTHLQPGCRGCTGRRRRNPARRRIRRRCLIERPRSPGSGKLAVVQQVVADPPILFRDVFHRRRFQWVFSQQFS